MRKELLAGGLAATVLLLSTSACTHSQGSRSSQEPGIRDQASAAARDGSAHVDISAVRRDTHYDYELADSLMEAVDRSSVAAVGEVVGWSDGRSLAESEGAGYEDIEFFAVLEIRIERIHRFPSEFAHAKNVYVELSRGGRVTINGEQPDGTVPVFSSIQELEMAVPMGVRVIVLGTEAPSDYELQRHTPGSEVLSDGSGVSDSGLLVQPDVQGLLFEDKSGGFVSALADEEDTWGWLPEGEPASSGFDYLLEELDRVSG